MAYTADDLMKCDPQPGQCERCAWSPLAEELCTGTCIGDSICPWLMVCQCLNPNLASGRGHQLERLVLQQPPVVQVTPVGILASRLRMDSYDIRLRRDAENVQAIAESIVVDGLFAPPGGVASADGHIDVIMGHTRVLAMRDVLSWTQIPMRIFHWWGDTDWDRRARAFKENGLRRKSLVRPLPASATSVPLALSVLVTTIIAAVLVSASGRTRAASPCPLRR